MTVSKTYVERFTDDRLIHVLTNDDMLDTLERRINRYAERVHDLDIEDQNVNSHTLSELVQETKDGLESFYDVEMNDEPTLIGPGESFTSHRAQEMYAKTALSASLATASIAGAVQPAIDSVEAGRNAFSLFGQMFTTNVEDLITRRGSSFYDPKGNELHYAHKLSVPHEYSHAIFHRTNFSLADTAMLDEGFAGAANIRVGERMQETHDNSLYLFRGLRTRMKKLGPMFMKLLERQGKNPDVDSLSDNVSLPPRFLGLGSDDEVPLKYQIGDTVTAYWEEKHGPSVYQDIINGRIEPDTLF